MRERRHSDLHGASRVENWRRGSDHETSESQVNQSAQQKAGGLASSPSPVATEGKNITTSMYRLGEIMRAKMNR